MNNVQVLADWAAFLSTAPWFQIIVAKYVVASSLGVSIGTEDMQISMNTQTSTVLRYMRVTQVSYGAALHVPTGGTVSSLQPIGFDYLLPLQFHLFAPSASSRGKSKMVQTRLEASLFDSVFLCCMMGNVTSSRVSFDRVCNQRVNAIVGQLRHEIPLRSLSIVPCVVAPCCHRFERFSLPILIFLLQFETPRYGNQPFYRN